MDGCGLDALLNPLRHLLAIRVDAGQGDRTLGQWTDRQRQLGIFRPG